MKNEMNRELAERIANYIGPMIKEGIIVNDQKIPFSMIDYYCISKENIYNIIGKIRCRNAEDRPNPYYTSIVNFIEKEAFLVRIIDDSQEILDQHNVFVINGERFEPTKEDIEEIFDIFDKNEIPRFNKLIFIALYRMAKKIPILPLMQEEKEKTR